MRCCKRSKNELRKVVIFLFCILMWWSSIMCLELFHSLLSNAIFVLPKKKLWADTTSDKLRRRRLCLSWWFSWPCASGLYKLLLLREYGTDFYHQRSINTPKKHLWTYFHWSGAWSAAEQGARSEVERVFQMWQGWWGCPGCVLLMLYGLSLQRQAGCCPVYMYYVSCRWEFVRWRGLTPVLLQF